MNKKRKETRELKARIAAAKNRNPLITQEELAKRFSVTQSTVSRMLKKEGNAMG